MLLNLLYNQNFLAAISSNSSTPLPSPQLHQQHSAALFLPSQNPCKEGESSQRGLDDEIKRHNYVVFEGKKKKQCFLKEFYVCSQNGDRP
jgi:hypothetical protein